MELRKSEDLFQREIGIKGAASTILNTRLHPTLFLFRVILIVILPVSPFHKKNKLRPP